MKKFNHEPHEHSRTCRLQFFFCSCWFVLVRGKKFFFFALCSLLPVICFGQVASRSDGVDVFYYDSLFEAVAAAAGSVDRPDEIALLADVVLDEPLIVDDGVHIRLVAGGAVRTLRRSGNLIEFPVVWVRGEGASLSLGKPGMVHELVIDGGRLNNPPIEAHASLVAVSGPGAKLIMYDKVTLQNNINNGTVPQFSFYQNGSGVYVTTTGHITDRQAEFIMKGGTIRGNMNDVQNPIPCGGGVLVYNYGIFTMEGGVIMDNAAQLTGGGFYTGGWGSFKKTGGIIYGSNAPAGYRNTAITGLGVTPGYGNAVGVAEVVQSLLGYRSDTVKENDTLSYTGNAKGNGDFGKGEKWDTHDKALLRLLFLIVLPVIAFVVGVFLVFWKRFVKKLARIVQEAADTTPYIDLENMDLSNREKDLCELLVSNRPLKEIADILGKGYPGVYKSTQKLYKKLGIKGRTELLVRVKANEK